MYSVFIIDDDKASTEITKYMFKWKDLNVDKIKIILSPDGLVERIISEKPDIVFIDIEIEDASGLDIVQECVSLGSKSLFVIISGHDNFHYAHRAANIGVIHYMLKPLDPADVLAVTKKLQSKLSWSVKSDIPDTFTIHGDVTQHFSPYISPDTQYRMILGSLSDCAFFEIKNLLKNQLITFLKTGHHKILFLIRNEEFENSTQILLNNYIAGKSLYLSISLPFSSCDSINENFSVLNTISQQNFITPTVGLAYPWTTDTALLKNIINILITAVKENEISKIIMHLKKIPLLFTEQRYTIEHVVLLYNTLVSWISLLDTQPFSPFPYPQMNKFDLLIHFKDLNQLCDVFIEYFIELQKFSGNEDSISSDIWQNIVNYINENFSNKISTQDICMRFFISAKTLYKLFKTNTNETFIEYLTRIRIEKSKLFLLTTTKAIGEIAEDVGIKDYYYFNKLFKKQTGVTPLSYRNQNEKRE